MKSLSHLFLILLAFAHQSIFAEDITLRFTANHTCTHVELDSVLIENLTTKGGSKTLFYPDFVFALLTTSVNEIDLKAEGMHVSQNYPNPFSSETNISVYVPEPDHVRVIVQNLTGQVLAMHESNLGSGAHSFTFHAGNQQTYLLTVNSNKYTQHRLMLQIGSSGPSAPRLTYHGMDQDNIRPLTSTSTIKGKLKSGGAFSYEPGDELRFTGYVTNLLTNQIDYAIITDTPIGSSDYFFDIANLLPETPSYITGKETVYGGTQELTYHVESVPGNVYYWEVPEGWEITGGHGTSSVNVSPGGSSGDILVYAGNPCGESPSTKLEVIVVFSLSLLSEPAEGGIAIEDGLFEAGQVAELTAIPSEGYSFVSWGGDTGHLDDLNEAITTLTMPAEDVSLTASFTLVEYQLSIGTDPEGSGSVSVDPEKEHYNIGDVVEITASAAPGYSFVSWDGDTGHLDDLNEAITTLTMPAEDVSLTASFALSATSCNCLLVDGITTSGIYKVLIDDVPTEVFCDMTSDGGGWTLVAVSAQGGNEWSWNNRALFTTSRTVFGTLDDMDISSQSFSNNYKNTGLHDIEMEDVMVRWASNLDSKWASYHNVSDGTGSLSDIISATPVSACAPFNSGYAKSAGNDFGYLNTGTGRGYCGERLYFNLRNTEGSSMNCGIGANNYSTYGPSFNYRLSHGTCTDGSSGPYNEPSYTGFGPCNSTRISQRGVVHIANAWTDLGLSAEGQRRSMLLFVR